MCFSALALRSDFGVAIVGVIMSTDVLVQPHVKLPVRAFDSRCAIRGIRVHGGKPKSLEDALHMHRQFLNVHFDLVF